MKASLLVVIKDWDTELKNSPSLVDSAESPSYMVKVSELKDINGIIWYE